MVIFCDAGSFVYYFLWGIFLYQFTVANYNSFGIQFRYLTIWGLTAAMVATWLFCKTKQTGLPESYLPFVSATAVLR